MYVYYKQSCFFFPWHAPYRAPGLHQSLFLPSIIWPCFPLTNCEESAFQPLVSPPPLLLFCDLLPTLPAVTCV